MSIWFKSQNTTVSTKMPVYLRRHAPPNFPRDFLSSSSPQPQPQTTPTSIIKLLFTMSRPTSPLDKSLPSLPPLSPLRSLSPIRPRSPFTAPPPFQPLPQTPPIPPRDSRRLSQRLFSQNLSETIVTPRPDSFTLPPPSHYHNISLANPHLLDLDSLHLLTDEGFYHVAFYPAQGSTPPRIQYWLRAEDVLVGLPGKDRVPSGHWSRLVQLAQETSVGQTSSQKLQTNSEQRGPKVQEVRLLTALYSPGQEEDTMMDVVDSEEQTAPSEESHLGR